MPQLTTKEGIFIIEKYIESKIHHIRQQSSLQFNREAPCKWTIQCNVAKYCNFGTRLSRNKGNSGRSWYSVTNENIKRNQELLPNNPHLSARQNGLGLTREEIRCHPYQLCIRQQLTENYFQRRLNWFIRMCQSNRFLPNIIIGDEACFSIDGTVNTDNVRMYAPKSDKPDFAL